MLQAIMCGICGFIGDPDRKQLSSMAVAMQHRGPDDKGFYEDGRVSLANRRLSVIDVRGGHQPITVEGYAIVYSGEVYNHRELRLGLERKGHFFKTDSDTEVVLHLYMEHGEDCLDMLNGMFAFAIWDGRKLFLARDRLGIKPLYYTLHDDKLYFASEIKSLLKVDTMPKEIDATSLNLFLSLRYDSGPGTIFSGIKKLMPGHCLTFDGRLNIRKYWDVRFRQRRLYRELRDMIAGTVRKQLKSEVPLGLFLSSGIDSALVAWAMKQAGADMRTFTMGFEQGEDETRGAGKIAQYLGAEHREYHIGANSLDEMEKIMYHADEPHADSTILPTYFLACNCKKHATVVLTGEGSDEIFAGYEQYRIMKSLHKIGRFVPCIARPVSNSSVLGRLLDSVQSRDAAESYLNIMSVYSHKERMKLLAVSPSNRADKEIAARHFSSQRGLLNKMQYFDIKAILPQLLMKVDKATMAHSVEARVPYLDHEIVEYAAQLPQRDRLRGSVDKFALRTAARRLVPGIEKQQKKRFYVPMDAWHKEIKARLEPMLEDRELMGQFNSNYVQKLMRYKSKPEYRILLQHNRIARQYYSRKIWCLFAYANWYRAYFR